MFRKQPTTIKLPLCCDGFGMQQGQITNFYTKRQQKYPPSTYSESYCRSKMNSKKSLRNLIPNQPTTPKYFKKQTCASTNIPFSSHRIQHQQSQCPLIINKPLFSQTNQPEQRYHQNTQRVINSPRLTLSKINKNNNKLFSTIQFKPQVRSLLKKQEGQQQQQQYSNYQEQSILVGADNNDTNSRSNVPPMKNSNNNISNNKQVNKLSLSGCLGKRYQMKNRRQLSVRTVISEQDNNEEQRQFRLDQSDIVIDFFNPTQSVLQHNLKQELIRETNATST